jgi:ammonia channel protein AmtB
MNAFRPIKALFLIVALYDGGLGAAFLMAPGSIFRMGNVTPPNHWAYVQFPAALLVIFALMFGAIARNPVKNKEMIIYGILLKLAYCGIAFWYWLSDGIPGLWKPFAVIDLVTAGLFVWSYRALGASSSRES